MPQTAHELILGSLERLSRELQILRQAHRLMTGSTKGPALNYLRLAGLNVRGTIAMLVHLCREIRLELPTKLDPFVYTCYKMGARGRSPGR